MKDGVDGALFRVTGVGVAAQLAKDDGSSIGVLTLSTDAGDLNFAVSIDGAEAIINAMNSYLEAAATHAGKH